MAPFAPVWGANGVIAFVVRRLRSQVREELRCVTAHRRYAAVALLARLGVPLTLMAAVSSRNR